MQTNHGGIPRSPSAALSMTPRPSSAIFDDMSIAQGLLNESKDPRQRSSMTSLSAAALDGSEDPAPGSLAPADGPPPEGRSRRAMRTSNTWTSSSGDVLSDHEAHDDRTMFVQEYNRLARKHGVRPMDPEDYDLSNEELMNASAKPGSWFSRKILRKTSSSQSVGLKAERHVKHRRSISDLSLRLKMKKDKLKDKDLQELVRLCGSSLLYLPTEYAAGSLAVPTCFRATAQYLVQHAPSARGVFRVSGSQNVVSALYNHYGSMDEDGQVVSGTVRCPTLPDHIRCDVHDVASAFKKFLSGLPGGVLGSLPLFHALISIQSQLRGDPEWNRTKQSKIRARLIALAIATLRSQHRRELICAVFGLLSMIGRAAEIAPREDDRGRPLPTSDLMGYGPLGLIFGPLLVGDLLEDYRVRIANPHGGLVLLPISPPKSRKERHKKIKTGDAGTASDHHVDKTQVANSIAEMLITHWRDVVRHMRNLCALKIVATTRSMAIRGARQPILRPSASESFAIRKPPDWDQFRSPIRRQERSVSPTPTPRRTHFPLDPLAMHSCLPQPDDALVVKKQRSKVKPMSSQRLSVCRSMSVLAPTAEENTKEDPPGSGTPATGSNTHSMASSLPPSGEAPSSAPSIPQPPKNEVPSPSTSSDNGRPPLGLIPLAASRDESDLDLMLKENKHPRPTLPSAFPAELSKLSELSELSNKQPLHFLSTPTFSKSSPNSKSGNSSRKKITTSKESSASSDKTKAVAKEGPKKLQKQSPGIMDRGRAKPSPRSRPLEPMAHLSAPREAASIRESMPPGADRDGSLSKSVVPDAAAYVSSSKACLADNDGNTCKQQTSDLEAGNAAPDTRLEPLGDKTDGRPAAHELPSELSTQQPRLENSVISHKDSAASTEEEVCSSYSESHRRPGTPLGEERKAGDLTGKVASVNDDLDHGESKQDVKPFSRIEIHDSPVRDQHGAATALLGAPRTHMDAVPSQMPLKANHALSKIEKLGFEIGKLPANSIPLEPVRDTTVGDGAIPDTHKFQGTQDQTHWYSEPYGHFSEECLEIFKGRESETTDVDTEYTALMGSVNASRAQHVTALANADTTPPGLKLIEQALEDKIAALDARWEPLNKATDRATGIEGVTRSPSVGKFSKRREKGDGSRPSIHSLGKPDITISRASSRTGDKIGLRSPRRIGGSDPGLQPRARSHSPRRVSRSLYDHPKRIKNVLKISRQPRDQLLRVSQEDDKASLVVLAQALAADVTDDIANLGHEPKIISGNQPKTEEPRTKEPTTNGAGERPEIPRDSTIREQAHLFSHNVPHELMLRGGMFRESVRQGEKTHERVAAPDATHHWRHTLDRGAKSGREGIPSLPTQVPNRQPILSSRPLPPPLPAIPVTSSSPNKKSNSGSPSKPFNSPSKKSIPSAPANSPRGPVKDPTGSPSKQSKSPSKISLLVAKFNGGGHSSPPSNPPSAKTSPTKSPAKTPTRAGSSDNYAAFETPKHSVVAQYTSNPASPAKPQKSERTPQSARAAVGNAISILDLKSSPIRKLTPKRVVREPLKDSTPLLRSVGKPRRLSATPSPTKAVHPYAVALRSVQKDADGSPTRVFSNHVGQNNRLDGSPPDKLTAPLDLEHAETAVVFADPLYETKMPARPETATQQTSPSPTDTSRRVRKSAARASSRDHVSILAHGIFLKPVSPVSSGEQTPHLLGFDGLAGAFNTGRVLPRPDPPPVAHHLQLPRPPTAGSSPDPTALGDNLELQEPSSNPPPGRSSSMLYTQVRALQRQLADRSEEIQHLKQQLHARENLDIGTLSEELRETKRELQSWKTRAEVAEKQLAIVLKLPSRSDSLKHAPSNSSRRAARHTSTSIDSGREEGTMADRVKKALHGLDGTEESSTRWSSDESSDTVVRDLEGIVVSGSEISVWMESRSHN